MISWSFSYLLVRNVINGLRFHKKYDIKRLYRFNLHWVALIGSKESLRMSPSKNKLIHVEDDREKPRYPRYAWVGNRISESDMEKLYNLKVKTKTPITRIVSQAVKEFLDKHDKDILCRTDQERNTVKRLKK
jgi:hypothetical protein